MNGKNFDVFISYRRSDGTDKARILDLAFSIDDCRTFLDFKSLGVGVFDKRLEDAVLDAPIFVMVLTPDYFARCNEEGDWVRREIELALDNGKIIIPINYDGKVNCAPDYLDEEFKSRIGCHNFKALHRDSSFDATVKSIFDLHIRPYLSTHSNNEGKAKVSVKADADCELILDDEIIATVQKDKTKQVFVERGEHFFTARSTEIPRIEEEIEKTIDDLSFKYSLRIKLSDKVQEHRNEIAAKEKAEKEAEEARIAAAKAEAERIKKEKEEAEQRLKEEQKKIQIEQAVKRLVYNPLALPKTLTGHTNIVYSVAASPDGKYLASGSADKTLIIWDAKSGEKLKTLEGHYDYVSSVCWSPDGKYLASGSENKTLIIWDANNGQRLQTLYGHSYSVSSVCWSPDGKYLVSGSRDETVKVWDAKSGECIRTLKGHSKSVICVCWSPDGRYLASGSADDTVKIWDANSGGCIRTLYGHSDSVNCVCWSPDGRYLASSSDDETVKIWDANSDVKLKSLQGHSNWVFSVCWSPDGKYLVSGSRDNTVIIWDANSGQRLKTLEGHSDNVNSICWSSDGKYLASGSTDKTVKIWGAE